MNSVIAHITGMMTAAGRIVRVAQGLNVESPVPQNATGNRIAQYSGFDLSDCRDGVRRTSRTANVAALAERISAPLARLDAPSLRNRCQ